MGFKEDMMDMGFGESRTIRALRAVQYESLERAIAWLEAHENDEDIDEPVEESVGNVLGTAPDPTNTQQGSEQEAEPAPVEVTDEERAAKAAAVQAKIAERRKVAEQRDKEDAVMREKIRRKEGQSLGEIREKRQQDEMREIAEDRRRQKIEDEKARKAVLDKIKQDRAGRAAGKGAAAAAAPAAAAAAAPLPQQPPKQYNECRLQLRLPTGQALVNSFKAEDTLGDVVAFIRDTAKLETFGLMTSFPRRQYHTSDYVFSLKSLGLCPSSVVIVSKQSAPDPGLNPDLGL